VYGLRNDAVRPQNSGECTRSKKNVRSVL